MKIKPAFGISLLLLSGLVTHAQWTKKNFQELDKLKGSWVMNIPKLSMTENWNKKSDTLWEGASYRNQKGEMALEETVQLVFNKGSIQYIVRTQGTGEPVAFTLSSHEGNKFIFENKEHDFPQRIIYHFRDGQHLDAAIEGNTSKGFKQIDFPFVKNED